jgi:hypothetical protein
MRCNIHAALDGELQIEKNAFLAINILKKGRKVVANP